MTQSKEAVIMTEKDMLHTMGCEIIVRDKVGIGKEWKIDL